ncbi:multidrug efflux SMR transporter [Metabacillus fastidiosus]|uniref:DMT family transporter n=1 Tax=Metabacillus fastidiosus TaxID=1458 RepID=UPI002DBD3302|nr:multidrug efflux SMR transporter [Metabacillus fastidiosus]MEC2074646.1 multidrug efflux SMR transporter [Metabacillus fastidiosus]
MAWVYLCIAILLEVAGTISMKSSEGFTRLLPSILLIIFYIGSLSFLTLALKMIDVSVAYAIWSGMGILVITFIGVFYFNESFNVLKIVSIILIIIGVTTLNFAGSHEKADSQKVVESEEK